MGAPLSGYDGMLQRLKDERAKLRYSQSEMGSLIGIRKGDYCKCEKGQRRITFEEMKRFCGQGVDVCFVITGNRLERLELTKLTNARFYEVMGCYLVACAAALTRRELWPVSTESVLRDMVEAGITYQAGLRRLNYWKLCREMRGITQPQMAEELGIDVKKLRNMEYGKTKPDSEILYRLYLRFRLSPSFFLSDARGILCELGRLLDCAGEPLAGMILTSIRSMTATDEKGTDFGRQPATSS